MRDPERMRARDDDHHLVRTMRLAVRERAVIAGIRVLDFFPRRIEPRDRRTLESLLRHDPSVTRAPWHELHFELLRLRHAHRSRLAQLVMRRRHREANLAI